MKLNQLNKIVFYNRKFDLIIWIVNTKFIKGKINLHGFTGGPRNRIAPTIATIGTSVK